MGGAVGLRYLDLIRYNLGPSLADLIAIYARPYSYKAWVNFLLECTVQRREHATLRLPTEFSDIVVRAGHWDRSQYMRAGGPTGEY